MILDFTKTKKVTIELKYKDEFGADKTFRHEGEISAYTLDIIADTQLKLVEDMGDGAISDTGSINMKPKDAMRLTEQLQDKVISSIMGSRYEEYKEAIKGRERLTNSAVYAEIEKSVNELESEIGIEKDESGK